MKLNLLIATIVALLTSVGAVAAEEPGSRPGPREERPKVRQLQSQPPQQPLPPLMESQPRGLRAAPVEDYGRHRLRPPPRGFAWVRTAHGFALVSTTDGRVYDTVPE